jgi:hypothetical protein
MPLSSQQERWEVYAARGTKEVVRQWLEPRETLSEFFRTALEHELARREKKWKAA